MDYMTVREAAGKWGISERCVQKYCAQGRIEGSRKFGTAWGIPKTALKPSDPRKKEPAKDIQNKEKRKGLSYLMPLMNSAFHPGRCMEYIEKMPDPLQKEIAYAEYFYFSGQAERAFEKSEAMLTSSVMEIRLSASLIHAYASFIMGKIERARETLFRIREYLSSEETQSPDAKAAAGFIFSTASVLLHLPPKGDTVSFQRTALLLPPGLRLFSVYVQAHALYLQGEYSKSAGMAEAAFMMSSETYPIAAIYLHLVCVMDYMSLRQTDEARKHMLAAWELARPDGFLEPFGEHHGLLGGMLEAVMKKDWPEEFKQIIAITYRFSQGWREIHNPISRREIADNLTTTEFAVAMLAARGWTNQEIGEHMNLSPNTVKRHISSALQKLHINRRQDLKKYMLL